MFESYMFFFFFKPAAVIVFHFCVSIIDDPLLGGQQDQRPVANQAEYLYLWKESAVLRKGISDCIDGGHFSNALCARFSSRVLRRVSHKRVPYKSVLQEHRIKACRTFEFPTRVPLFSSVKHCLAVSFRVCVCVPSG